MSYMIYDVNGYVGDLASNKGYSDLVQFITVLDNEVLGELINNGCADITELLVEQVKNIPATKFFDINDTVENLKTLIDKCEDVIIITDGVGVEEPDEETGDEGEAGDESDENEEQDEEEKPEPEPVKPKKYKRKMFTQGEMEVFWKAYANKALYFEKELMVALRELSAKQLAEALGNLKASPNRNTVLIDKESARVDYALAVNPIMTATITDSIENGQKLIAQKNPHKSFGITADTILQVFNKWAIQWLKTRIAWAAMETTEETALKLQDVLSYGYSHGQSIRQMQEAIREIFEFNSQVRAERIARTEIIAAANIGYIEGYKSVGVEKIRIYAAMDERGCELCDTMHDTVHPITEGYTPPFHPNCRCVVVGEIE